MGTHSYYQVHIIMGDDDGGIFTILCILTYFPPIAWVGIVWIFLGETDFVRFNGAQSLVMFILLICPFYFPLVIFAGLPTLIWALIMLITLVMEFLNKDDDPWEFPVIGSIIARKILDILGKNE